MNKNMKFWILTTFLVSGYSCFGAEPSLLADSDPEVNAELILESIGEDGFSFSVRDMDFSYSQIRDRIDFLGIDEQAKFLSIFSEWKLIHELLQSARISMPVDKRASKIRRAISIAMKINEEACIFLLQGWVGEAVNSGEIRLVSHIMDVCNENGRVLKLESTQWDKLFESAAVFNFLRDGPSLYVHDLLRRYKEHLDETQEKSRVDHNYIELVQNWTLEDTFKTQNLLKEIMDLNK